MNYSEDNSPFFHRHICRQRLFFCTLISEVTTRRLALIVLMHAKLLGVVLCYNLYISSHLWVDPRYEGHKLTSLASQSGIGLTFLRFKVLEASLLTANVLPYSSSCSSRSQIAASNGNELVQPPAEVVTILVHSFKAIILASCRSCDL